VFLILGIFRVDIQGLIGTHECWSKRNWYSTYCGAAVF